MSQRIRCKQSAHESQCDGAGRLKKDIIEKFFSLDDFQQFTDNRKSDRPSIKFPLDIENGSIAVDFAPSERFGSKVMDTGKAATGTNAHV